MKSHEIINELKCWSGYHRVKGRPAGSPGSCAKNTNEEQVATAPQPSMANMPGADQYASAGKKGGGFWAQGPAKTVQTDLGPIVQRQKQYVATPTAQELISKGLQGKQSELAPVTAAQAFPKAPYNPNIAIQSATTDQTGLEKTQQLPNTIQSATTQPTTSQNQEMDEEDEKEINTEPKPQDDNRSSMRGLMDLITTVGRAATSMKGRDLGADLKSDVKTMIRNKVTGEPNR